jgi:hypothetical protein
VRRATGLAARARAVDVLASAFLNLDATLSIE